MLVLKIRSSRKNSHKKMISIIIPAFNEEKYLPLLLKKLKRQTFQNFELIVADAFSTDRTRKIALSFSCKIVDGGLPAKGRNEGAKIAKGDLLLFLDADNIYLEDDFLEKAINLFNKKKLDVAGFFVFPNGHLFDLFVYSLYYFFAFLTQGVLPHATNAILVKKEIFQKVGGFDESILMGEDHHFVRKAKQYGKFQLLPISIITSARRQRKMGFLKLYFTYFLGGILLFLTKKFDFLKKLQKKFFSHYFTKRVD